MVQATFVPSLSGEEIIIDLCTLIAEKLRKDCNLREIDSYSLGYSAKVTISLKCYGFDETPVQVEFEETNPTADPELLQNVVEEKIEVPQETDLSEVRDRSKQDVPNIELTVAGPVEQPKPRRYSRRLKALAAQLPAAQGAAVDGVGELTESSHGVSE